jgi:hypothetical protein
MWSDDKFEDELRLEFSMMDSPAPTAGFVEHTVRRYRRWRLRRRLLAATPGVVAATGLGVALGLTGVSGAPRPSDSARSSNASPHHPNRGTTVQLANYVFHLPSGFHLTDAVTTTCRAVAVPATNPPVVTGAAKAVRIYPYSTAQIAAAADTNGGCVYLALTALFTPTTATLNPYVPFTGSTSGVRKFDVDGYSAWLTRGANSSPEGGYLLSVELPRGNGQMQDLAVGSIGLSTTELLTIISKGLS